MKILPVSDVYNRNSSFKGMWGDTKYNNYTESECYIYDTIKEYYPFKDETDAEIDAVKEKYSDYKTSTPGQGYVADPWPQIESTIITVMAALPFTAKEFLNYTKNRLPIIKKRLIERTIAEKGLTVLK